MGYLEVKRSNPYEIITLNGEYITLLELMKQLGDITEKYPNTEIIDIQNKTVNADTNEKDRKNCIISRRIIQKFIKDMVTYHESLKDLIKVIDDGFMGYLDDVVVDNNDFEFHDFYITDLEIVFLNKGGKSNG